jgi:cyclin C
VDRSPLTRVFPLAPALALLHSFLLNDTYRTDVHLLYPPYVIALSALYIGFCLTALNNATSTRTRSSSSQLQTLASSIEVNAALGLPPPPKDAAAFIASFEVAMPVLLACVQDIVVLYPIWEAFEPTQRAGGAAAGAGGMNAAGGVAGIGGGAGMGGGLGAGMAGNTGMGMTTLAAAAAAASAQDGLGAGGGAVGGKKDAEGKEKFGPEEAEALVRRMIEERMVDVGHPDNAGVTGTANGGTATGTGNASGSGNASVGGSGIAQVAGKKRKA